MDLLSTTPTSGAFDGSFCSVPIAAIDETRWYAVRREKPPERSDAGAAAGAVTAASSAERDVAETNVTSEADAAQSSEEADEVAAEAGAGPAQEPGAEAEAEPAAPPSDKPPTHQPRWLPQAKPSRSWGFRRRGWRAINAPPSADESPARQTEDPTIQNALVKPGVPSSFRHDRRVREAWERMNETAAISRFRAGTTFFKDQTHLIPWKLSPFNRKGNIRRGKLCSWRRVPLPAESPLRAKMMATLEKQQNAHAEPPQPQPLLPPLRPPRQPSPPPIVLTTPEGELFSLRQPQDYELM